MNKKLPPPPFATTNPILDDKRGGPGVPFPQAGQVLAAVMRSVAEDNVLLPPMSPIGAYVGDVRRMTETQLRTVVESEPAVAARIMAMANADPSSVKRGSALNLRAALSRFDSGTVAEVVEQVAKSDFVSSHRELIRNQLRKLWTNTVYTALSAREFARWTGRLDPEDVYLAALFHNIGEPVFMAALADQLAHDPIALRYDTRLLNLVVENHPRVGAMVLERWGFPDATVKAAMNQAEPPQTQLDAIIALAFQGALRYGYTYLTERYNDERSQQALDLLRLDRSVLDSLLDVVGPALNRALSIRSRR